MHSITSKCESFMRKIVTTYASGGNLDLFEAIHEGQQPRITNLTIIPDEHKHLPGSNFYHTTRRGAVNILVNATIQAGTATDIIPCSAHNIPLTITHIDGDNISMAYDSPKITSKDWTDAVKQELKHHQDMFEKAHPFLGTINYLGTLLNKVFFKDDIYGTPYIHLCDTFTSPITMWHQAVEANIGLFISLNVPNANWFNVETLPLSNPKELIRELHQKVLKRRHEYTLNELYIRAATAGML